MLLAQRWIPRERGFTASSRRAALACSASAATRRLYIHLPVGKPLDCAPRDKMRGIMLLNCAIALFQRPLDNLTGFTKSACFRVHLTSAAAAFEVFKILLFFKKMIQTLIILL